MSDKTARNQPTLAHPLIVSPAKGVRGVRKKPRCLPPFPGIDLNNWAGFHVPSLHWIGINVSGKEGFETTESYFKSKESWQVHLAFDHEFRHAHLGLTPFSRIKTHEDLILYTLIHESVEEGQEIPVPLRPDLSRNELEKQWGRVVECTQASRLIEEVYAVRSSLLKALAEGLIGGYSYRSLRDNYRAGYNEFIPGYAAVYDLFDFVAGKIGETAATAIILNVLDTINPVRAFVEILCEMCPNDPRTPIIDASWIVPPEETELIKNLSIEQAYLYFSNFLDELDPDDSVYRRKDVRDNALTLVKQESILSQYIKDDVAKFVLGSPMTALVSAYSDKVNMYPIYKVDVTKEVEVFEEIEEGNFTILLESILQQLIHGMGLVCPFWFWLKSSHSCCGGSNRAFLEKVCEHTKPDKSCPFWMRLGCLTKEKVGCSRC
jgi:hypothetical protein